MRLTLEEFLRDECRELAIDTDDYEDAMGYLHEIIRDATDLFPERISEIETLAQKILKEETGHAS